MPHDRERIRALNDELRRNLLGGGAVITAGIAALGPAALLRLVQVVTTFDDFCNANDPHEEHDFGSFEFESTNVLFKIDYYDKSLSFHSPDPADPAVTERVITIMRSDEY
jgi:hypothetical protein